MPLPPLDDPTDLRGTVRSLGLGIPSAGLLWSTVLAGNAAQVGSLALLPLSRRAFRRVNREIAGAWWGMTVALARRGAGARAVVTGDDVPPRENALVVANHQQMPDITFLMHLARDKERLGDMKWFVKDAFKYVPGAGWGMLFLDCLFVKRDWAEDEASIGRTFARIVKDRVPLWLMLFPEGTRATAAKIEASRAFAERRGLRPPRHVMVPRTKGFSASVRGLRSHLDAVYDITIGYPVGVPTLWQYIKGLAPRAHLHVRRYPVADLPAGEPDLARWLLRRFEEKDALLETFYAEGAFPAPGV